MARGRARCCAIEGTRPRAPDRRAHRAELPAAPVRRRDADRALRAGGRGHRRARSSTRARRRRACGRSRRPRSRPAAAPTTASGLYDAILIKENHVGARRRGRRGGARAPALRARAAARGRVRARSPRSTRRSRRARRGILLDNMDADAAARGGRARRPAAPSSRPAAASRCETLRAVASTGVDFISVGALTHSAPALDLSLILEPLP